jgi:hypothetical protein
MKMLHQLTIEKKHPANGCQSGNGGFFVKWPKNQREAGVRFPA